MPKWWEKEGIRFQCQGSGKCCLSRGEYGFVYMTDADRRRMAKHLKMDTRTFTKNFCEKTDGLYHLKELENSEECLFLKDNRCTVYEGRPTQCRTWPFWPEVMSPKAWNKDVASFCPGVGKGEPVSPQEIRRQMKMQERADS